MEITNNKKDVLLNVDELEVSFFTYAGEVKAVRKISYDLKYGEAMGIVGESGSGKSVASYALMGIIPEPGKVIGGSINFENKEITNMPESEMLKLRGKDVGMIFQDPMTSLNPIFTVGSQIDESLKKHTDLDKEGRRKRIIENFTNYHFTSSLIFLTKSSKNHIPHKIEIKRTI